MAKKKTKVDRVEEVLDHEAGLEVEAPREEASEVPAAPKKARSPKKQAPIEKAASQASTHSDAATVLTAGTPATTAHASESTTHATASAAAASEAAAAAARLLSLGRSFLQTRFPESWKRIDTFVQDWEGDGAFRELPIPNPRAKALVQDGLQWTRKWERQVRKRLRSRGDA